MKDLHWRLFFDFRIERIETIFDALEKAFVSITEKGENSWFDGLSHMEHDEAVFGIAFVTSQTYILGTVSDINEARKDEGQNEIKKYDYYSDSIQIKGTNVSVIELVNEIANYYKHHDEWESVWPKNHTTQILAEVGINSEIEFPC